MLNLIKDPELIHDGLETSFLGKNITKPCPLCNGVVSFCLYNSLSYDAISNDIKKMIKIKGAKLSMGEFSELKYKGCPLRYIYSKCTNGTHNFLVVFSYGETQPARYVSYLLGFFEQ